MANSNPNPSTQFKPGNVGNPGGANGRNREIEQRLRALTRNGAENVEFLVGLKRGVILDENGKIEVDGNGDPLPVPLLYRDKANQRCTDRIYGKTPLVLETSHEEVEVHRAMLILTQLPQDVLEAIVNVTRTLPPLPKGVMDAEVLSLPEPDNGDAAIDAEIVEEPSEAGDESGPDGIG